MPEGDDLNQDHGFFFPSDWNCSLNLFLASAAAIAAPAAASTVLTVDGPALPTGIAISLQHAGPPPADIRAKEPAVFVFSMPASPTSRLAITGSARSICRSTARASPTTLMGSPGFAYIGDAASDSCLACEKLPRREPRWKETHGYRFDGLTESEASYLGSFNSTDAVRDRLAPRGQASGDSRRAGPPGAAEQPGAQTGGIEQSGTAGTESGAPSGAVSVSGKPPDSISGAGDAYSILAMRARLSCTQPTRFPQAAPSLPGLSAAPPRRCLFCVSSLVSSALQPDTDQPRLSQNTSRPSRAPARLPQSTASSFVVQKARTSFPCNARFSPKPRR
jgi:hypothetical protein